VLTSRLGAWQGMFRLLTGVWMRESRRPVCARDLTEGAVNQSHSSDNNEGDEQLWLVACICSPGDSQSRTACESHCSVELSQTSGKYCRKDRERTHT
jgi:hypothetical protein